MLFRSDKDYDKGLKLKPPVRITEKAYDPAPDAAVGTLRVKDGKAELVLPRDSVQVFHCTAPALVGKTIVTLQVNDCKAKPGEALYVIGDCPELGSWDLDRALRLEYVNSNTWSIDVPFNESAGVLIRYKYLIRNSAGRLRRENCLGHKHRVPESGRGNFRDLWESLL